MRYLSPKDEAQLKDRRLNEPFVDEVLQQLDRILASDRFQRVQQKANDFLRFIVAKKLLGQDHDISEMSIAISVYKEGADYDPAEKTKIRVAGGRRSPSKARGVLRRRGPK